MNGPELKRFPLLADFTDQEREELADRLEARTLQPEETLFTERDEAEGLVLLESGALRVTSTRSGESATLVPGAALGGASLFAVGPREVSAVATQPARVQCLGRNEFRRLAEDAPRAACRLAEAVAAELAQRCRELLPQAARDAVDQDADGE